MSPQPNYCTILCIFCWSEMSKYYCSVCDYSYSSPSAFERHLISNLHNRNMEKPVQGGIDEIDGLNILGNINRWKVSILKIKQIVRNKKRTTSRQRIWIAWRPAQRYPWYSTVCSSCRRGYIKWLTRSRSTVRQETIIPTTCHPLVLRAKEYANIWRKSITTGPIVTDVRDQ